jgi:hypothetical protein
MRANEGELISGAGWSTEELRAQSTSCPRQFGSSAGDEFSVASSFISGQQACVVSSASAVEQRSGQRGL